jgi:transketolase
VEAHYIDGGVGSLVAEIIAERGLGCRLIRSGVRGLPIGDTGSRDYLFERHGLAGERLADAVVQAMSSARR